MVDVKCDAKVHLRETKYHEKECDLVTSKIYTVVNTGCGEVKLVAAKGDKFHKYGSSLILRSGKKVTLQNYKCTWYVVA